MSVRLDEWTTLRLGGPPARSVDATSEADLVAAVRDADASGEPLLVVAGGSNLVVADEGFPGVAVRVLTRGIEVGATVAGDELHALRSGSATPPATARPSGAAPAAAAAAAGAAPTSSSSAAPSPGAASSLGAGPPAAARPSPRSAGAALPLAEHARLVTVAAGEPWDGFVARCVADGLSGVECLSGIPGSVGATPIQNVGAYGQDVAETIVAVRVWDRRANAVEELAAAECAFTYRSSAFKRDPAHRVVLAVTFALEESGDSRPIRYAELARTLGVPVGASAPLADVREAVLGLRRGKGMVLDPEDPDTRSAGSFFTNPILAPDAFAALLARAGDGPPPPGWPEPDGRVKTSAAWLIQHAGFGPGHGSPTGIAISSKHTLALTNRGAGTATELLTLAREIAAGVHASFGVALVPEPVFVGLDWP